MTETGVIHGRFQVLHNDHLTYILAGKARCRHLIVGITNTDPLLTRHDATDLERSAATANPLSYFERYVTVRHALVEAGIECGDFSVVPLPINIPELYRYYVPLDAVFYLTIYDDWGRRKLAMFQELGLKAEVMWERPLHEKGITSNEVRKRMIRGEDWEHLVPVVVAKLMKEWNIPARLRTLAATATTS